MMRSKPKTVRRISWILLLVAAFWLQTACSGDESASVDVEVEDSVQEDVSERSPGPQPAAAQDGPSLLLVEFEDTYRSWLRSRMRESALEAVLTDEEELVAMRRRLYLAHLYSEREFRPIFVERGELTHRALALLQIMESAGDHAMDASLYMTDELMAVLAEQERWASAWQGRPSLSATEEQQEALAQRSTEISGETRRDRAYRALESMLVDDVPEEFEELAEIHSIRERLEKRRRGADAIAEALLADQMLQYASDMRHGNVRMFGDRTSENERFEIIAERMRGTFEGIANSTDEESAHEILHDLRPHQPQYDPLFAERQRYLRIVEEGGWEEVRPFSANRGRTHPRIPALKERLQIEGYFDGEMNDRFDDDLVEAIRHYQRTHQMDVTGDFHSMFWTSLNIPAQRRFEQIELTMNRWRESRITDEDYYIFVNIPDFHLEAWRNGVREKRFGVVVGNNRRQCNPRTREMELVNATPIDSFRMTYLVLNPYWYVPRRLVQDDLLPRLLEDETFFERMGYEPHVTSDGFEVLRQRPGPENALGRVKFMFPNQHNVYMHDTPAQNYFRLGIRSMSSGCVRLSRPMEFMRYLLENDDQWNEARVQRIFDSERETSIVLNTGVPVFFEYYVVRVDDDGYANFLADIYRYDREILEPDSVRQDLSCEPPGADEPRLVLSEDGRAMFRDSEGNLIDPNAEEEEIIDADLIEVAGEDDDGTERLNMQLPTLGSGDDEPSVAPALEVAPDAAPSEPLETD